MSIVDEMCRTIAAMGPAPDRSMRIHPDDLAELKRTVPTSPAGFDHERRWEGLELIEDADAPRLPRLPTCEDCTAARTRVWGGFRAGCRGCCARALSRCPDFARVRANGRLDRAYGNALQQFGLTHEQVKAAHAADFEGKERP